MESRREEESRVEQAPRLIMMLYPGTITKVSWSVYGRWRLLKAFFMNRLDCVIEVTAYAEKP